MRFTEFLNTKVNVKIWWILAIAFAYSAVNEMSDSVIWYFTLREIIILLNQFA